MRRAQAGQIAVALWCGALWSSALWHPVHAQDAPQSTASTERVPADKIPAGMVLVPAGPFIMGTNAGDRAGDNVARQNADAQPQHTIIVEAFAIDKTEVTNEEYQRYCKATGYPPPPHWPGGT